jgi:predicted Zn-dependent protease
MQQSNTQKKLFNLPILLLIITILLLLLFALFPWTTAQYMDQQTPDLLREQFSSSLKTKYYQILKDSVTDKKNILEVASSLRKKGLWQASTHLLTKKLVFLKLNEVQKRQYNLMLLANSIDAYHKASGLTQDNRQVLFKVRQQLQKLEHYNDFSQTELQTIAKTSADFGLLPLSVTFYYRLANQSAIDRSQWFSEAGKWANQSGDYSEAAKAFKLAGESLNPTANFNQYTEKWLTAMIKSNQFGEIKSFFSKIKNNIPTSLKAVEKLANIAIQAGFYHTSSYLFTYLALHDQISQKQRWYEKASYWSFKAENYHHAAKHLIKAEQITNSDKDRWAIQQRLIDIYVKGKKPEQALTVILPMLKKTPENRELADKAIQIALENKKISIAREFNQAYLKNNPHSLNALNNQIEIEMLDKKYVTAIHYIKRVINIMPNAIKPRQQWAQLEEHEGNYQLALELWQWIYKISKQPKHLQKMIQLAQGNIKKEGLETLQQIALQQELPRQAVYDVFFHLVNSEKKKSGEQFLKHYLDTHQTDKKLLETLAQWYAGENRYKKSLRTWQQMEKKFGSNNTSTLNRFELHWLLRHKRKAHQLWLKNKQQWMKKTNSKQLSMMADVAWQYQHKKIALFYYKKLINKKYKRSSKEWALQYSRIAILHEKLGHHKTALSTYRKGFIKTLKKDLLINGLQLSFGRYDKKNFKRLTALAKKHKRKFRSNSRYWLLQAASAQRDKHYKTALRYYRKVLLLRPRSREARRAVRSIKKHLKNA